ncbi:polyphosphate kinase 1 [Spirochaeta thermophila DSM 6578]|uniref:Polyphosphate kinase n=1 Tax=Winmispira thermophila (strain ATCC 700085 / DSM 6578 / Z-1203) TaxID=869211 RepID=G0GG37_WINT7|nr:polyphosphate kinase 1 [Spirochaeta thermophila]AEJ62513.1 polyphosphate kinase 1 [Spirochaeta thermophila DSM 6578]
MNQRFFHRDLSWVEFNARVLAEGLREDVPLLERVKFLAITGSNFDEFFQVRVATLRKQRRRGDRSTCPSGIRPSEAIDRIHRRVRELLRSAYEGFEQRILPQLEAEGIPRIPRSEFDEEVKGFFLREVFPLLTPVSLEGAFPFLHPERFWILGCGDEGRKVLVEIPPMLPPVVFFPGPGGRVRWTFLEEMIEAFLPDLVPGVRDVMVFRVLRDADLSVDEERDEDFLRAMEEVLEDRASSRAVALFVREGADRLAEAVREELELEEDAVFRTGVPLALSSLFALYEGIDRADLKDPPWPPVMPAGYEEERSILEVLDDRDLLLHHPYESFYPVIRLLEEAAEDPEVLVVKIVLYRTAKDSRIVAALERAARKGKQVVVLLELKARFDEARNIEWAKRLERAGAIVLYGISHLKVHAKALMVIRKDGKGIRRYVHVSTGNYNERTAQLYSDIGFMTSREDLAAEIAHFFNMVTGYTNITSLQKLAVAPHTLKPRLISLIEREIHRVRDGESGRIMAKMNALADPDVIEALYRASQEGVEVLLNVRGVCMLVPGVPGLSERIRVVSIVDRFLEHSRIYYFENGGEPDLFIASADWMPRNLERRVELMIPVESPGLKRKVIRILTTYFADTTHSYLLTPQGSYTRVTGPEPVRAQEVLYRLSQREDVSFSSYEEEGRFRVRKKR